LGSIAINHINKGIVTDFEFYSKTGEYEENILKGIYEYDNNFRVTKIIENGEILRKTGTITLDREFRIEYNAANFEIFWIEKNLESGEISETKVYPK
jgi:hypothetical protein